MNIRFGQQRSTMPILKKAEYGPEAGRDAEGVRGFDVDNGLRAWVVVLERRLDDRAVVACEPAVA